MISRAWLRELLRHDGALWRRAAMWGATRTPEWFRRAAPPAVGAIFYALMGDKRRTVRDNVARLLGTPSEATTARMFVRYAECLTDSLEMRGKPDVPVSVRPVGPSHFVNALAMNRGVIALTAHTGGWEVAAQSTEVLKSVRTTMVMAREAARGAQAMMDPLHRKGVTDVLYAEGEDPATALTLLSRLRNGEIVAIQIDRPPRSGRVITVPFGPLVLSMPEGPFRLAQASGAPLVPVFSWREGHREHALQMSEPLLLPRRATPEQTTEAAREVAARLYRFVREHPDQWFHFQPLQSR